MASFTCKGLIGQNHLLRLVSYQQIRFFFFLGSEESLVYLDPFPCKYATELYVLYYIIFYNYIIFCFISPYRFRCTWKL